MRDFLASQGIPRLEMPAPAAATTSSRLLQSAQASQAGQRAAGAVEFADGEASQPSSLSQRPGLAGLADPLLSSAGRMPCDEPVAGVAVAAESSVGVCEFTPQSVSALPAPAQDSLRELPRSGWQGYYDGAAETAAPSLPTIALASTSASGDRLEEVAQVAQEVPEPGPVAGAEVEEIAGATGQQPSSVGNVHRCPAGSALQETLQAFQEELHSARQCVKAHLGKGNIANFDSPLDAREDIHSVPTGELVLGERLLRMQRSTVETLERLFAHLDSKEVAAARVHV